MDIITHKCPNCGGALTFDPSDQKFHCPYCFSIFTEQEVTDFEEKQKEATMQNEAPPVTDEHSDSPPENTMSLFLCPSCGAEIVTDETTAATYCYFCHNPVVLSGRLSGEFLPNKVLPFKIEKEEAVKQFLAWTKKKWFVPPYFFDQSQIEKLTGVYFPYWVVNANGQGELSGTGTTLRIWRVGEIEYTETKQFAVERQGNIQFNDLVKNALSKNTQQKMVESVQPFPIDQAIDFKNQYLAGFQAEKRDIEYQTLSENVKKELTEYGESILRNSVNGYTNFRKSNSQLTLEKIDKQYMLLPVWLVTYRNKQDSDTIFYYAMNGQTGKVSGILPISYKRLGLVTGGIFAVIAILLMIGGYFI